MVTRFAQPDPATLRAFAEVVGADHVVTDPEIVAGHVRDWTGRFVGRSAAVLRPGTTAEVAGLVEICAREGIALTLQGGNTGLVGGSVPLEGEVILSLGRLSGIGEVDPVRGQLTAGAGTSLALVQSAARAQGWVYGVDFSARDTATLGGSIATNAGGYRVLRHGPTRRQVLGVEVVLGDGSVLSHLGGLVKEVSGYDIVGLMCGSEGTLGVVTAARIALLPPEEGCAVALVAFGSLSGAMAGAGELRRVSSVDALEVFRGPELELVASRLDLPVPFPSAHTAFLLVESTGKQDAAGEIAESIEGLRGVEEVAVATEPQRRRSLWRYRDGLSRAVRMVGVPHKLDVALPEAAVADFVAEAEGLVSAVDGAELWVFGHAGEGNLHLNLTGLSPDDEGLDEVLLQAVASRGGSISAEHGIGSAKRRWLHLSRSQSEIAAFRRIKNSLDPEGILNPNVLLAQHDAHAPQAH